MQRFDRQRDALAAGDAKRDLRARKSNPAVTAGDERDFSCKLAHGISPFFFSRFALFHERAEQRAAIFESRQVDIMRICAYIGAYAPLSINEDERCQP
jgi:hypothetical protein